MTIAVAAIPNDNDPSRSQLSPAAATSPGPIISMPMRRYWQMRLFYIHLLLFSVHK